MNTINKLASWGQVTLLCTAGGILLGSAFDRILWEWSYDYVYPSDYCRNHGIRLGAWMGTLIAAATVVGARPIPSLRWTCLAFMTALMATLLGALTVAAGAWGWSKSGWGHTAEVPLSRFAFCSALVSGGTLCGWCATLGWIVIVRRHRRANASCRQEAIGSTP